MEEGEGYNINSQANTSNSNNKRARLESLLCTLLEDPVLRDVPRNPCIGDIETLIGLELGSAMKLLIRRMDDQLFDVAVQNSATVKDLKLAVVKKVNEMEQSQMGHRQISWRHVWSNFCLCYMNQKLTNDGSRLQEFGIRNNSQDGPYPCPVSHLERASMCEIDILGVIAIGIEENEGQNAMRLVKRIGRILESSTQGNEA